MRLTYSYARTGSTTSENNLETHVHKKPSVPIHMAPILGVRYTKDGKRLVYRAHPPEKEHANTSKEPPNCIGDTDRTLVDIFPDMAPSGSK